MPARAISGVAQPPMAVPAKLTLPRLAFHRRMMVRSVVLLPAPLRPSSTVMAPAGTSKSTPCKMWYWPIWVCTPSSTSSGSGTIAAPGGDAQIGLLHDRRADHFGRRAIRHQATVVEHDNTVGEALDHVHFVLNQQDGLVARALDALDQLQDHGHVGNRHARGRFIEHEDSWLERHHDGHLEL